MSEPFWVPLGGGAVDYKGDWAAGTQYAPGDVVRRNGIDYLAVNPSLGLTPPAGTPVGWRDIFNEAGDSLANWTTVDGTWTVTAGALRSASNPAHLRFTNPVPELALPFRLSADILAEVTPSNGVGLMFAWGGNGGASGAPCVQLFGSTQVRTEYDASSASIPAWTPSPGWAVGTWCNLGVTVTGGGVAISLNGRLVGIDYMRYGLTGQTYVGLRGAHAVSYKNIRLQVPAGVAL